ncbi:MAG: hypothetical protein AAFX41_08105 [Bacteroidota bacterium]
MPHSLLDYAPLRGLLGTRLFRSAPRRNAFVELHNALAAATSVWDLGPADTLRISREHGVDLTTEFAAERHDFYVRHLTHVLNAADFGDAEVHTLAHLARTLFLTPADLHHAHDAAFDAEVQRAAADHHLTPDETLRLAALARAFDIEATASERVSAALRSRVIDTAAHFLSDDELDDDEAATLDEALATLAEPLPSDLMEQLHRARQRWLLRHGPLPVVDIPLPKTLRRGEVVRFYARLTSAGLPRRGLLKTFANALTRPGATSPGAPTETQLYLTEHRVLVVRRSQRVQIGLARLQAVPSDGVTVTVRQFAGPDIPLRFTTAEEAEAFTLLAVRLALDPRR